jgi:hypothetical protein
MCRGVALVLGGIWKQEVWLLELWIRIERIRPAKPQHNGRLERLHGTMERELAVEPATDWCGWTAFGRSTAGSGRMKPGDEAPVEFLQAIGEAFHGKAAGWKPERL